MLSIGQIATLSCLLEVSTPKPGNVHRGADFEDLTFNDFVVSAVAIAPAMESAVTTCVGQAVLAAVKATHAAVDTNTNLGTVLLLAPLASVPRDRSLAEGIPSVLEKLTADDARDVYEAIRIAQPGGLGKSETMDVENPAPDDLLSAMKLAADRDLVARQFVDRFGLVLESVAPSIANGIEFGWNLTTSILHAHLKLMSEYPDCLIARKCGDEAAKQSAVMAQQVMDAVDPTCEAYQLALSNLDFWLRSDGHRRNPGTTADLIAAGLFAALRDELIQPPFK